MTDPTITEPTPAPVTREIERIIELVSVLEDSVTRWARGATPESRSIRADNAHAAQTAVRAAITAALARSTEPVVPEITDEQREALIDRAVDHIQARSTWTNEKQAEDRPGLRRDVAMWTQELFPENAS